MVLTGQNGAGKTNLLEAVSFLTPGRGLRRAKIAHIERRRVDDEQASGWAISTRLETPEGQRAVGIGRDREAAAVDAQSERRILRIDGTTAKSQTALAELGAITWLTPEMDRIFMEGTSERRRFLDRLVYGFVPRHASRLSVYEKTMRERNRLLREGSREASWLSALETTMAENGVAIAAARVDVVSKLAKACELGVTGFPTPQIAMQGWVEEMVAGIPALKAEDSLRDRLKEERGMDSEAGRTMSGPHRSDLIVHFQDKDMPASLCSTGEQKALLVSIILAAARLQRIEQDAAPILLLDEVAAHLDPQRREALFNEIDSLGAQAWMTGTDKNVFEPLVGKATFFTVANGAIEAG